MIEARSRDPGVINFPAPVWRANVTKLGHVNNGGRLAKVTTTLFTFQVRRSFPVAARDSSGVDVEVMAK